MPLTYEVCLAIQLKNTYVSKYIIINKKIKFYYNNIKTIILQPM